LRVGSFEKHGELVPGQPRYRVALANQSLQALADLDEGEIARGMAKCLSDQLETIHVQQNYGQGTTIPLRAAERLGGTICQQRPVGEIGQVIEERLLE
jgi:hypothetical protein